MKQIDILEGLYDYQLASVEATDKNSKGIVCLPTGTGKTLVEAAIIAKEILTNSGKFGVYVLNAPRIILSYQLLKEVYTFLVRAGIDARYMSVHSGGPTDIENFEEIRIDANYNNGSNIEFAQIENGTSTILIHEFCQKAKQENIPVIFFSTYNSADRIATALRDEEINLVMNDEAQYLVQEHFYNIIEILKSKRCYFFTATTIHTPSDKGRGMNNSDSYGDIIYQMVPREAIDKGKMVRPRMHFVIPPVGTNYTREDFQKSLGGVIFEALSQHAYAIGQGYNPKVLITVKGLGDILTFMSSREYVRLIRAGWKIYAVGSDPRIGNDINGKKVSRVEFLDNLKEDGQNSMIRMVIFHCDILAEGINVPGITGIMPLRTLAKAKFLQTFGRAARLDPEDRSRIENGDIKPNDLIEMVKPYAWVIVPTIVHEDADDKEHVGNLITELREYGFDPSQDIVSTDSKNGLPVVMGAEALLEIKKKCPKTGSYIEKVEADYEQEYIASLNDEEKIRYKLRKEFQV
jgi:superfamily II DNA or RNA helicase